MLSNKSRRRFWNFLVSFSDSAEGDSIPMNTRQKFALTIASISAGREARSIEASVKNPNGDDEVTHRSPQKIMDEIAALDAESAEVLGSMQSILTRRGAGWVEKTIAQCFKVRSGDFLPTKAMIPTGKYDVYGGNGVAGKHDQRNQSGENIIIGRVGAKCGNVRHVKGDIWVTDNAFYISEYFHEFDLGFLARLLERKQLRSTANQAAQPVISYTTIKDVVLEFPLAKASQIKIESELKALENETQHLESIYQNKLAALDELKKSVLHQAFNGAL